METFAHRLGALVDEAAYAERLAERLLADLLEAERRLEDAYLQLALQADVITRLNRRAAAIRRRRRPR